MRPKCIVSNPSYHVLVRLLVLEIGGRTKKKAVGDETEAPKAPRLRRILHTIDDNVTPVLFGLPSRTIAWTVSSELLGFCFHFPLIFRFCAMR